ncbi:MAG: tail fiber domain-containing protein [Candidatus Gastranaerophilales bacterium]|nr:tail fiber domain-containing protein [Candidatus Gastranaerophilales bacterium]
MLKFLFKNSKHKKAVSLIETLLSMSILSIVIIALIPVMTVRRDAADPNSGSGYWKTNADNPNYISPVNSEYRIIVGTENISNPYIGAEKFYLFNTGFSNKNLPALSVSQRFDFNGQIFDTNLSDNTLPLNSLYIHTVSTGVLASDTSVVIGSPLAGNSSLNNNTAIGFGALQNGSGNNIAIGTDALGSSYAGNDSIGIFCGVQTASYTTPELFIGSPADPNDPNVIHAYTEPAPNEKNVFQINGNLTADSITANVFYITSDKRLKTVTGEYKTGLKEISKIQPVVFSYKNDKSGTKKVGVIAQDLQKVMPKSVVKNPQTGYYMVDENSIFYATLNAVKDLKKQSDDIEKENKILEEKLAKLKAAD